MNNRNVYMHGLSAMMLLSFWILILTVLMHVIYIRKTPHNIIRHENSMLLLANRFFRTDAVSDRGWSWTDEPWPWEGGNC